MTVDTTNTESEYIKEYSFSNDTGDAVVTIYHIFPGVEAAYITVHMDTFDFKMTEKELRDKYVGFHWCQEGRIEQETDGEFFYLMPGDCSVVIRDKHAKKFSFPTKHYHGISIGIDMAIASEHFSELLKLVDLKPMDVAKRICGDRHARILRSASATVHIQAVQALRKCAKRTRHTIQVPEKKSSLGATLDDLLKKFRYYRLSLYTFAMASFIEIMLSGDFKEENILCAKEEIEKMSEAYRELFGQCSMHLEKMSDSSIETNLLKGIGTASKAVGKLIESIPVIKEGQVDEFLQDRGEHLKDNAVLLERKTIEAFAEIGNPGVIVFTERMSDMINIYCHTEAIYFDDKQIYLTAC